MTSAQQKERVEKLAREFAQRVRVQISFADLRKVIELNAKESAPDICHSEDFCDSHGLMEPATVVCFGRAFLADSHATKEAQDALYLLWNRAWTLAKANRFYISETLLFQLERLGFCKAQTGGGCLAMYKTVGNGLYLMCTDGESPDMPADGCSVCLGLYTNDHSEAIMEQVWKSGAELAAVLATS